jgi:hypothetical protein
MTSFISVPIGRSVYVTIFVAYVVTHEFFGVNQWIGAFMGVVGYVARPRSTFFDGWFVRVMDKMEGISWALIVGSIRLAGLIYPY